MTARPHTTPARLREASQRADRVTGWIIFAISALGAAAVTVPLFLALVSIWRAINAAPLNLLGLGG